jgi:hypothetical protein
MFDVAAVVCSCRLIEDRAYVRGTPQSNACESRHGGLLSFGQTANVSCSATSYTINAPTLYLSIEKVAIQKDGRED